MTRRLALLLLAAITSLLPACSATDIGFESRTSAPDIPRTLDVDGRGRTYLLHVPATERPDDGWPLVIVTHGLGGSGGRIRRLTGFDELAEREGFVVAYPEGLTRAWLDAGISESFGDLDIATLNVAFIDALIDELDAEVEVDPRRVYVTGLSNGGMFAFHVACQLSDRVAAVGLVAAASITQSFASCAPDEPVAYIAFHGTADEIVPYAGGPIAPGISALGEFQSAREAAAFWVDRNGCPQEASERALPDIVAADASTAVMETWAPCASGADVALVTLNGAGHTWPGHPPPSGEAGQTNLDIDATEMLWEFFEAHPKAD